MNKTKQAVKRNLKKAYDEACNGYLVELLRMWEWNAYYGYWIGDVYVYGDCDFINMSDIIFCVENDVELSEYREWQEYTIFANEFRQSVPNFPSWHKGCPRLTKGQQERLVALKKSLNDCIDDYNEKVKNG